VAILKHIASKNANYGSAIDYLKYQHDEFHLVPILDENGNMMLRDEFYLEGLNCDPETFDLECELLNQEYNKNNTYDEIKSHHYIISHDPRDNADHDLTGERAQAIGLEYAKANFPGHQALVCTHTDGNNGTGNIHTHMIRMIHVLPPFTVHRFSQLMRIDDECIFSTGSLRKLLCLYQLKHIPLVKIISS